MPQGGRLRRPCPHPHYTAWRLGLLLHCLDVRGRWRQSGALRLTHGASVLCPQQGCPYPQPSLSALDAGSQPLPRPGQSWPPPWRAPAGHFHPFPSFCYFGAVPRGKRTQRTSSQSRPPTRAGAGAPGVREGGRGGGAGAPAALHPQRPAPDPRQWPLHVGVPWARAGDFWAAGGGTGSPASRGRVWAEGEMRPRSWPSGPGPSASGRCQEHIPSAVRGKIFYQRSLSLKKKAYAGTLTRPARRLFLLPLGPPR